MLLSLSSVLSDNCRWHYKCCKNVGICVELCAPEVDCAPTEEPFGYKIIDAPCNQGFKSDQSGRCRRIIG